MKICIVNPKLSKEGFNSIPQGVLSVCSMVKSMGFECDIFDYNRKNYAYDILKKYDVIGISAMSTQLPHAVQIAESIQEKSKVVWGGIHVLLDPESILNRFKNHYVVRGESEFAFVELLKYFDGKRQDFRDIEGVSWYENDKLIINPPVFIKDLNTLPDINYYNLPLLEEYIEKDLYYFPKKYRTLDIVTGRGCIWDCSFCINSIYRKHKAYHRVKSFEKIMREADKVIDDLKIEAVTVRDDDFFAGKKLVDEWIGYAQKRELLWTATCRYNYIKENMVSAAKLKKVAESGCFELGMATEAGLEDTRNRIINKRLYDNEIRNAIETIKKCNINTVINTSFVVYFPGDTPENRVATIKWMDYLSKQINIVFSGPQIYRSYPGCRLYETEKIHPMGSLEYYLGNMSDEGFFSKSFTYDYDEMIFYSDIIREYFNTRFHLIERSGKNKITVTDKNKEFPFSKFHFVDILFITINLRLKYDYWDMLIEPALIGRAFRYAQKLYRLFKKIFVR